MSPDKARGRPRGRASASASEAPISLVLTFVDGPRGPIDVQVDTRAGTTIGAVLTEVAAMLGDRGALAGVVVCERTGRALIDSMAIADAGIRSGDRLTTAGSASQPAGDRDRDAGAKVAGPVSPVELVVTSGPGSGQRVRLASGESTVGRDRSCDVTIDDPSMSRRHLLVRVRGDVVEVSDPGSSNGSAIDAIRLAVGQWRAVAPTEQVEFGRTLVAFETLRIAAAARVTERAGHVDFNRPPRIARPADQLRIELAAPPDHPRKLRLPLAASLLPLVAGGVMYLIFQSASLLVFSALTPMMMGATFVTDRRSGRRDQIARVAAFREHVNGRRGEHAAAAERERVRRREEAPDAGELTTRAIALSPALWERRPQDADFLSVRVGVVDQRASSEVKMAQGGAPELRAEAETAIKANHVLPSVPLTTSLRQAGVLGLCGERRRSEALARWLLVQAATLHSPQDLLIGAAVAHSGAERWDWMKWLPHAADGQALFEAPIRACGDVSARTLLVELQAIKARRIEDRSARIGASARSGQAHVLLLLDEDLALERSLVTGLLSDCADAGISVIWLGRERRDLPGQSAVVVEAAGTAAMVQVTLAKTGETHENVSADGIDVGLAERTARALTPVRDVSAAGRSADVPRRVSLLELLDLPVPAAAPLIARWEKRGATLKAPIGAASGHPLTVDLRSDGPHALIAGTTGSGKSELLRTFVASFAASHPPSRLTFLLVDYKGGAAFGPCAGLPHVVDLVSDLDEHLAQRALVSLDAELKRRERILADTGAKDLIELERRAPDQAPPTLVIVVDEFAKLRDEVPEFVDGVVDIAQRGRSLGVHMVLAAQSLRTAFSSAIRANTNLRIALRVSDEGESEDVIAAKDAARIPSGDAHKGRGFARTGHGQLTEFQTAYVSGRSAAGSGPSLRVRAFEFDGSDDAGTGEPESSGAHSDLDTDLTALAVAARQACEQLGIAEPHRPWLPVLSQTLALDDLVSSRSESRFAIGLIDDPAHQRQDPLVLDLEHDGNCVVFGAGGSGKTTLLRTVAAALALSGSPDDLQVFGIDASGRGLGLIEHLPHCGAVIGVDDEERVERLLTRLARVIDQRTAEFAAAGATTLSQIKKRPDGPSHARIVLLVDDMAGFAQVYDQMRRGLAYELLLRVLASGRAVGVHVVASADRRSAIGPSLNPHIGTRLALRMPSEEDLVGLGLEARLVRGASLSPGRGFTSNALEIQIATPQRPQDDGPSAAFSRLGDELTRRYKGVRVAGVAALASEVARSSLPSCSGLDRVPIGIGGPELGVIFTDLSDTHLLVAGPYRTGRSTALETIVTGLSMLAPAPELHLLAPRRSPLEYLDVWASAARGADACAESLAMLLKLIEQRTSYAPGDPIVIVVDDGGEITDSKLERIVRRARDVNVRVVAAAETSAAAGISVAWLRELRKDGRGILLRPNLPNDGAILAANLPRRASAQFPPGRGFAVTEGVGVLVQIAS